MTQPHYLNLRFSSCFIIFFYCGVFFSISSSEGSENSIKNPFLIEFENKKELSIEDYKNLQVKLDNLKLLNFLEKFYFIEKQNLPRLKNLHLFLSRNLRSAKAIIIDESKQLFPKKELKSINGGGDVCIVCAAPFRANYVDMLKQQARAFEETGFKGFHLSFIGAYPNPTGDELKFAAVPYAFKIFAIKEAALLGFKKVVWIDAAYVPRRNIQFLEDLLDSSGAVYTNLPPNGFAIRDNLERIPNSTKFLIKDLIGVDPTAVNYVVAAIMGFNTTHHLFEEFIKDYYSLVEMGRPFLSFNPEEYVLSAIMGQKKFQEWYQFNDSYKNFSLLNKRLVGKNTNCLFNYLPHPEAQKKIW